MVNVQLSHPGEYLRRLSLAANGAARGCPCRAALLLLHAVRVSCPRSRVAAMAVVSSQFFAFGRRVIQLREALHCATAAAAAAAAAGGGNVGGGRQVRGVEIAAS